MPSRPIPPRPSLEFDRKQARALLDALRQGDDDAVRRLRAHHPRYRAGDPARDIALHDAQLVIAREYGFASWPRWRQFVEARQLDIAERAALLVRAACGGDMRKATTLLEAEPTLERFDFYTACVCGATEHVARLLERDPSLARRRGGPLDREPILYACLSPRHLRGNRHEAARGDHPRRPRGDRAHAHRRRGPPSEPGRRQRCGSGCPSAGRRARCGVRP